MQDNFSNNYLINKETISNSCLKSWLSDRFTNLEIEVGCSYGTLISQLGNYYSNKRFIGIDKDEGRCIAAARRVFARNLSNVLIVNMEASEFFTNSIYSNSVASVHIYFPSPYPRTIRLLNKAFLNEVYRVLITGGVLRIATDHQQYFREIYSQFYNSPWWHLPWTSPIKINNENLLVGTPCEIKYSSVYRINEIQVLK